MRASENYKWSVRLGGRSALPAEQGRRGALPSLAFLTVAVKADRESVSQQREGLRRPRGLTASPTNRSCFPSSARWSHRGLILDSCSKVPPYGQMFEHVLKLSGEWFLLNAGPIHHRSLDLHLRVDNVFYRKIFKEENYGLFPDVRKWLCGGSGEDVRSQHTETKEESRLEVKHAEFLNVPCIFTVKCRDFGSILRSIVIFSAAVCVRGICEAKELSELELLERWTL